MKKIDIKNEWMRFLVVLGIIVIPLMYSYFYLKAFWDPYGQLDKIPVALVNLDEGEKGEELVEILLEKNILHFIVENTKEVKTSVEHKEVYGALVIPADFTKSLNSAETDKTKTKIMYYSNQKTNFLASQIISRVTLELEGELKDQVTVSVVDALTDKLKDVPNQLSILKEATGKVTSGSDTLTNGILQLQTGVATLDQNYSAFHEGISSLQNGSTALVEGTKKLESSLQTLVKETENLQTGLTSNVLEYTSSVDTVADTFSSFITAILTYGDAVPSLRQDPNFEALYKQAYYIQKENLLSTLKQSSTTLNQGLTSALIKLKEASLQLLNGGQELVTGSTALQTGLTQVFASSTQIQNGISSLSGGITTAYEGSTTLKNGLKTIDSDLAIKIEETNQDLSKLEGLSEYTKDAVSIEEENIGAIDTYGLAFAPYFMSISLWVGCLMIFMGIYYDPDKRFKLLGRHSNNRFKRSVVYIGIGALQAILLATLLKLGLGYTVTSIPLYYFSCILISVVYLIVVQFLFINFKDIGKFLAILCLVIQLAACGGTFPLETVPTAFQNISDFLPMHYAVELLKESLVSRSNGFAMENSLSLMAFALIFFACTVILDIIKNKKHKMI